MALSLIMVLCLLVYRLAEHRLRQRLVETGQTVPDQLRQPTNHPTLRWVFQCFEGIELLHIHTPPAATQTIVLRLEPLHEQILALLGPPYQRVYHLVRLRSRHKKGCSCPEAITTTGCTLSNPCRGWQALVRSDEKPGPPCPSGHA